MKSSTSFNTLLGALIVTVLAACGGSGGGGGSAAATGSSVVGTIAGFGSIIMSNGVEYDTDDISTCEVDDLDAPGKCEDSLAVGMTVSLQLGANGAVTSVHYDDELEGPATNVSGSDGAFAFKVFGANITTTNPGTQWQGFTTNPPTPGELDGANVEVSGEWQDNMLSATFVELQDDTSHEAKGTVGTVSGSTFPLTLKDGTVINVDATNANLVPAEGDYIEVKGTYDGATFNATMIELEDDDDFDSDGEAEITGILMHDSTVYSIGSTTLDISNAPGCADLVGSVVEAEGRYDTATGVLIVEECEDEEDELEMECLVGNVTVPDPDSMPKVGSVECTFPGTTGDSLLIEFRDTPELARFSDDSWSNPFDLTDVFTGNCVEIEAGRDSSGAYVAGLLELEDSEAGCDAYKLEGPVDAFTDNENITVLGVTFIVNIETSYPEGTPVDGDYVKITDENGDGTADSVKLD